MAPQDPPPDRVPAPPEAPIDTKNKGARGILERQHERRAARRRRRLVSARNRRSLARSLRATASQTHGPRQTARRHPLPLHYRAVAVRTELLEIAAALERAHDPDPACVTLLHELLADFDSPLYNPHIPATELDRTLRRVRAGLAIRPDA